VVNCGEHTRAINGHGVKGKHHNVELKALQNAVMVVDFE